MSIQQIKSGSIASVASSALIGQVPDANAPSGSVIQVVQATYDTFTQISSTTFLDSGLSASITPSAATSKILVLVTQPGYVGRDISFGLTPYSINLVRNSTQIALNDYRFRGGLAGDGRLWAALHTGFTYLDSPNTTSSTTYKTQAKMDITADSAGVRFNVDSGGSSMVLLEIAA